MISIARCRTNDADIFKFEHMAELTGKPAEQIAGAKRAAE
jgi:hypothetical protein